MSLAPFAIGYERDSAAISAVPRSSRWMLPFCGFAFLFFQGAFTHLFGGEAAGGGAPLGGLYAPIALAIQLFAIILLTRRGRLSRLLSILSKNLPLMLALAFIAASTFWSIDPSLTGRKIIALFGTTAVGFLIYIEVGRDNLLRFFAVYLAIFTVGSVLIAIGIPSLGTHVHDKFEGQWRGLTSFKNQAAWGAALFLLTWFGARKSERMKSWNYPLLALGLLMLIKTGSATGLIAISFGGAAYLGVLLYSRYFVVRPIILTVIVMISISALMDFQLIFESALEVLGRDASLTGRTSIWSALWPLLEARAWLGNGYLAFWDHAAEYFGNASWMADIGHAHNAYIEIVIDVGIVGLATQILFLLSALRSLFRLAVRKRDRDAVTMFVIFLTLAVIGIAGALFFRANTGVWVMIVSFVCYATDPQQRSAATSTAR